MTDTSYNDISRRHDFVLLFEVTDGNPNGDPDAGNLPRVDPETMQGLVTDVSLKRRLRDYVDAVRGKESRFKIYVQGGEALNSKHQRAYDDLGIRSTGTRQSPSDVERAREWMCGNFYDIRLFGAVMTTGVNCGQVRGPVQMTFARSIDPIMPLDISITRIAITRVEDAEVSVSDDDGSVRGGKRTEMGRKSLVPYGLYRTHGFFNPHFAAQTGLDEDDMELFWKGLVNMWDLDRSSSRGLMACRELYIFSHDNKLGNAPAHSLFERVSVVTGDGIVTPRRFQDYDVHIDLSEMPDGVSMAALVE